MKRLIGFLLLFCSFNVGAVNIEYETIKIMITSTSPETFKNKGAESFQAYLEDRVIYVNGADGSITYIYKAGNYAQDLLDREIARFNEIIKQEIIRKYIDKRPARKSPKTNEVYKDKALDAITARVKKEILRGRSSDFSSLNMLVLSVDLGGLRPPIYDYQYQPKQAKGNYENNSQYEDKYEYESLESYFDSYF